MPRPDPHNYPPPPSVCPVCGADVHPKALACPECGADHETGWDLDETLYDGLNLPDPDDPDEEGFDYDDFIQREFGHSAADPRKSSFWKPKHIHPVWWITAIILLLAFLLVFL